MPPLVNDNRLDAQFPNPTYGAPTTPEYAAYPSYTSNIGDNNANIVRLRSGLGFLVDRLFHCPRQGIRPLDQGTDRASILASGLSVVSAAISGADAGPSDSDPRSGSHREICQIVDHPAGLHRET